MDLNTHRFTVEDPECDPSAINSNSCQIVSKALVDRSVRGAQPLERWQFERLGYFCVDSDSTADTVRAADRPPQHHHQYILASLSSCIAGVQQNSHTETRLT